MIENEFKAPTGFLIFTFHKKYFSDKMNLRLFYFHVMIRGGSRTIATSKMERFGIIVNDFQPLTIMTKRSILDVAAVIDPPLMISEHKNQ